MRDDGGAVSASTPVQWLRAIATRQDRAAFAALFEFYAPRIKGMLMRRGASADAAEDFAQETLLVVWRKAAQFDPALASASAWVYTIARNLRVDRLRRDQRAVSFALYADSEPQPAERPDDPLERSQQEQRVRSALAALPQEQVRVVELSFFEGRAHGDIAERLGLPLGTVKSRLRLAMGRLRNLLGEPS